MAFKVLACPNCGADLNPDPGRPTVRCEYCGKTLVNTAYLPSAGALPVAAEPGRAPGSLLPADEAAFLVEVRRQLQTDGALHYAPEVPHKKEANARAAYGERLRPDERILALVDTTLLGGGEDGFILTARRFGWKNLGHAPQSFLWEELEPELVQVPAIGVMVINAEKLSLGAKHARLLERLHLLLRELSARAQGNPARAADLVEPLIQMGTAVWAEWTGGSTGGYFPARVLQHEADRYQLAWEDGYGYPPSWEPAARVMVPRAATAENTRRGAHVAARWTNRTLYGGTVLRAEPGRFQVSWDDGGAAPTYVKPGDIFVGGGKPGETLPAWK